MIILALPGSKNPNPWGHKIYNFRRVLNLFKYTVIFYSLQVKVKTTICKHYIINIHAIWQFWLYPAVRTLSSRDMKC